MDEQLNQAPCGFLTLSTEGTIFSMNEMLLRLLGYQQDELDGQHINVILSPSAQMFFQLYFIPMVTHKGFVEEMYLSLVNHQSEEIPILLNASKKKDSQPSLIDCVFLPMQRRNDYEDQLLFANKVAKDALNKKQEAMEALEAKQAQLIKINKQNQNELQLAKKIQETSLTDAFGNDKIQIESYYKASKELSGDIYGFYQINDHQYGVILLDVMGHGISSALVTMSLQSSYQKVIPKGMSPASVMKELDSHLHYLFHHDEEAWHYCTAIYLLIDTEKQTMEYINSGHPPAIYQNKQGKQETLGATNPPLGTFEGITYHSKTIRYDKGSRLLLYTDGISELIGYSYLKELIMNSPGKSLTDLKEEMALKLKQKQKRYDQKDDQCFILVDLK
ncbi:SpoIIE family protein phosphatase [Sediminibacillus halophilus]|uniref:Sigma-B regulation protein RsbU (Phosphoserine phosphatase) n=1 Tax=Sediminibacillus halophilus TaxID=482461 RepID=A0A1G9VFW1_9BACI|nr:SpoIIE family protein phosphatase [Sediminibacillus halophilus]SDM70990.1 sigma-B regulation protein RsbU (phosphoserine phosphatase) [Sediminibacillus halophilus]